MTVTNQALPRAVTSRVTTARVSTKPVVLPADFDAYFAVMGVKRRDWTKLSGGQK